MEHAELLGLSPEEKKAWFKQATISHRLLGDHSNLGANRTLAMKVPSCFPSSTNTDILC
ncbi:MAG: hypothetical protein JO202_04260 [Ktedonobacteraceae bacterium]|nr:hypothetical protein [Ktedonobacteraceae bacterium]